MAPDLPEKVNIVQLRQPVLVVDAPGGIPLKAHKAVQLGPDSLGVPVKLFVGEHLPHLTLPRGVPDPRRPAPQKRQALMPRLPQMPEREVGNHVADMEAPPGGVRALVEGNRSLVHQPGKLLHAGTLLKKAPDFQILKRRIHGSLPQDRIAIPGSIPLSGTKVK